MPHVFNCVKLDRLSDVLCVLSPDKPGPIQHLRVSDVRSDSAYLSWKDPEDNGGTRITNFVVEKKDTASTQWVPVCSTSKKRSMMLKHLMEGTSYMFRVAAENQYGRSEFVETPKATKAMNPLCEYNSVYNQLIYYVYIYYSN